MQFLAVKVSKVLDIFSIYSTKFFLGIIYVSVFSVYGIIFKFLKVDLLRLDNNKETFWLDVEEINDSDIKKQY